ncbi:MAG: DUF459 domain-containing protein [Lentisphaerae bacterium]|nr:DUF459 domain-containing protein [Lentisphaerota bacterium]
MMKVRPCLKIALVGLLALGAGGPWTGTVAETPAPEPSPPTPATSPVLILGDSMMRLPGMAMERELTRLTDVEVTVFSGIGTGLARLDVFDWLAKIDELCARVHPKVAVIALGANDRQPMLCPGSATIVQPDTPEWLQEYAARVGQAMDRLLNGGCERVIWLLLPPMRDRSTDAFARQINTILQTEAAKRGEIIAHDFSALVADRRTGGYTDRIMDLKTAAAVQVRETDGIHLSPNGARLLATDLIRTYWP